MSCDDFLVHLSDSLPRKQPVTMSSPWKFPKVLILICFQLNHKACWKVILESLPWMASLFLFLISFFGIIMYHLGKNNRFPSPALAASQTSPMLLAIAKLFHMQRWLPWTVFNLKSVAPPALSTFTPLHIFCIYIYIYTYL